ncbi:hypothetical protein ABZ943_42855, partial [Streptomyces rubiginosohelvolus]
MQHGAQRALGRNAGEQFRQCVAVRGGVAAELASRADDAYTYARAAFAYVRDTIPHSADSGDPRVTWRASDVLATRTG